RRHRGDGMSVAFQNSLLPTYPPSRVTFVDGLGACLSDADGREYLDFAAGIAVVSLGHRHPAPLAAAHAQLDRLWHASNLFGTEPVRALAAKLSERFGGAQAFFCNSGAEANEAALKYARKATGKSGVIALEGSFHGRTLGALGVTGQPAKRAPFEPLAPTRFATPNDVDSLLAAAGDDGCLIVGDDAPRGFAPGDHGSTFGGNPVSCAAAIAVCRAIDDDLLLHVRTTGVRLADGLAALPGVTGVRGTGLLVGAVLDRPAQ